MAEPGSSGARASGGPSKVARGRAIAFVVVVAVAAALVEVLPVGFTLYGGVLLLAWLQGRWDPTWNDGDGWLAGVAALAAILVAALAAMAVRAIARAGRLPVGRTICVTVGCSLAAALIPGLLLVAR